MSDDKISLEELLDILVNLDLTIKPTTSFDNMIFPFWVIEDDEGNVWAYNLETRQWDRRERAWL